MSAGSVVRIANDATDANAVFVALAMSLVPHELAAQRRGRLCARVLAGASNATPAGTVTLRAGEGGWLPIAPRVTMKVLRQNRAVNTQTVLIRMLPGSRVEAHLHAQEEECLVLQGEVFIGTHRLGTGDMHVAQAGCAHEAVTTRGGALMLVRSEIPLVGYVASS